MPRMINNGGVTRPMTEREEAKRDKAEAEALVVERENIKGRLVLEAKRRMEERSPEMAKAKQIASAVDRLPDDKVASFDHTDDKHWT